MQSRRSFRLMMGALLLALPLLNSCGFGLATDRPYTPGEGTNNRDGDVKVLSAVVVAAQPESGTFIATFSNNGQSETAFSGLEGAGDWSAALTIGEVDPVEIAPGRFLNLADEGGVPVTGNFEAGNMLSLRISFDGADPVTMDVPVVLACDEYEGLDTSGQDAESGESPAPSAEAYECRVEPESGGH